MSGFADEGVRIGTDAVDAPAAGKPEDLSLDVLLSVDNHFAQIFGNDMHSARPVLCVLQIEASGAFVARRDPDVVAAVNRRGLFDGVEGVDVADADLPGFLDDL